MALNREELLGELKLKTEVVTLDDGSEVIVSEIGATDYINLWTSEAYSTEDKVDMAKFTPALIAYSVVDDQGRRLFSDEDILSLGRSANGPFFKIAQVAKKLNGLSGEPAKNSEAGQEEGSLSVSPSN